MLALRSYFNKSCTITPNLVCQQTRNTFILKRRNPLPLHKKGGRATKMRGRHFVFDLVKDTNVEPKPNISVVLKEIVPGIGNTGDVVSMKPMQVYKSLLLPGHAVYATPENLEKYKSTEIVTKNEEEFSSPYAERTVNCLKNLVLNITMNKLEPWTLEPWHIRASFRKSGFVVPEHAIQMPPIQIKGPDLTLQEKEFFVTVTINNKEKVNVRCRIHHWATGLDRLPWEENHWKKPREPLIPEQAATLEQMPLRT